MPSAAAKVIKRRASDMEEDGTVGDGNEVDGTPSPSAREFGPADWVAAFRTYEEEGKKHGSLSAAARSVRAPVSLFKYHYDRWERTGEEPSFRKGPGPRLGDDVERELVAFIILMADRHMPLTRQTVMTKAKLLAKAVGLEENDVGGEEWLRLFLQRNPSLSVRVPQQIENARIVSPTTANVQRYFDNLEVAMVFYKQVAGVLVVNPEVLYNMDEAGICMRDARAFVSRRAWTSAFLADLLNTSHTPSLSPTLILLRRLSPSEGSPSTPASCRSPTTSPSWPAGMLLATSSSPPSSSRGAGGRRRTCRTGPRPASR